MNRHLELRFGGSGGQGLQLSAKLLADALAADGWQIARSQSYEPTSRGGLSRADLVLSDVEVDYPLVTALDYLVLLDSPAIAISVPILKSDATVIADQRRVNGFPGTSCDVRSLPLSERALALGNERVTNIVALGALTALSDFCPRDLLEAAIRNGVPRRLVDLNLRAFEAGVSMAGEAVEQTA